MNVSRYRVLETTVIYVLTIESFDGDMYTHMGIVLTSDRAHAVGPQIWLECDDELSLGINNSLTKRE